MIPLSRRIRNIGEPLIDTFNRRARELVAAGVDLVNLGQALPGGEPPPAALAAARRALPIPATHVYSPDDGLPELRREVARWVARQDGVRLDADRNLIVTAGANQALMLALQCCGDQGDRVLLPSPYFMNHEMAVRLVDAVPVEVPTTARNGYVITARALRSHFRRRTRAVIVTTPNNPTGAVVPSRELQRIARECARRGAFLILDRSYAGFEFGLKPLARTRLSALPPNVVLIGSFSKIFAMTGWRVGYLAGSPELVKQALKAQDTAIICAPTISQLAVRGALSARRGVPRPFLAELRRRRNFVQRRVAALRGWSSVAASGGFFAFIRIEGLKDSTALAFDLLDRAHVLVMPGRIFGRAGEGHIRLSYGVAAAPRLQLAFDRIEKFAQEADRIHPCTSI